MALKRAVYCPLNPHIVRLEGIEIIHSSDGLPLGVLGIRDGIPDHVLKEHLEDNIRSEYTMRIGKICAHICALRIYECIST